MFHIIHIIIIGMTIIIIIMIIVIIIIIIIIIFFNFLNFIFRMILMLTVGCGMPAIPSSEASPVFSSPQHEQFTTKKTKTCQNIAHAQSSNILDNSESLNDIMILNLLMGYLTCSHNQSSKHTMRRSFR